MCHSNTTAFARQPKPCLPLMLHIYIWWVVSQERLHNAWRHCFQVSRLSCTEHSNTCNTSLTATLWCCYFFPARYMFVPTPGLGRVFMTILMVVALYHAFKYCTMQYFPCMTSRVYLRADQYRITARIVFKHISRIYVHLRTHWVVNAVASWNYASVCYIAGHSNMPT